MRKFAPVFLAAIVAALCLFTSGAKFAQATTTTACVDSVGLVYIGPSCGHLAQFPVQNLSFGATTAGDLLYAATNGAISSLNIGTNGQCLLVVSNLPAWANCASGSVTSVALSAPSIFAVTGTPITSSGTLALALNTQSANLVFAGPGTGSAAIPSFRALVAADIPSLPYVSSSASQTQNYVLAAPSSGAGAPAFRLLVAGDIPALSYVTSVGLTMPAEFSVGSSPVTSSGTIAVTKASQTANLVYASPNGSSGVPTFRGLVLGDLPVISFSNLSGSATAAQGGTGQASYTVGDTLYASGSTALSRLAIGTNGQCYVVSSGLPAWGSCGSGGPSLSGSNTWTGSNTFSGLGNLNTVSSGANNFIDIQTNNGSNNTRIGPSGNLCSPVDNGVGANAYSISSDRVGPNTDYINFGSDFAGNAAMSNCVPLYNAAGIYSDGTPSNAGIVKAYPWHPASSPSCSVGVSGTSCSTTVTLPHSGMDCAANLDGTALLGGLVGEVLVSISGTTETLTYATPTLAGGGTVNFHNVCN